MGLMGHASLTFITPLFSPINTIGTTPASPRAFPPFNYPGDAGTVSAGIPHPVALLLLLAARIAPLHSLCMTKGTAR